MAQCGRVESRARERQVVSGRSGERQRRVEERHQEDGGREAPAINGQLLNDGSSDPQGGREGVAGAILRGPAFGFGRDRWPLEREVVTSRSLDSDIGPGQWLREGRGWGEGVSPREAATPPPSHRAAIVPAFAAPPP